MKRRADETRISEYTGKPVRPYRFYPQWQREDVLSLAGHGYPQTEIARLTGMKYQAVRSMLHRARKKGDPRAAVVLKEEVANRISAGHARRREASNG